MPVVEPLLHALLALTDMSSVVVLAASVQHSPETVRSFCLRAAKHFTVEALPVSEQCSEFCSSEVRLLKLVRREVSGNRAKSSGRSAGRQRASGHKRNA